MATEFLLPDLGENIEEGEALNILVAVGDRIEPDQPVLELETGKATVEVPADVSGTVARILIKPGDHVKVGAPVFTLEDSVSTEPGGTSEQSATAEEKAPEEQEPAEEAVPGEEPPPETPPAEAPQAESKAAESEGEVDLLLPDLGENVEEGDVVRLLVEVGDALVEDQSVLEIETGKATVEVPATLTGTVTRLHVLEGARVRIGQPILRVAGAPASHPETVPATDKAPAPPAKPAWKADEPVEHAPREPVATYQRPDSHVPVRAAPSVRKFAREIGVDIYSVQGTAEGERITMEDVKAHTKRLLQQPASASGTAAPALPDFSRWGPVRREAMSGVRKLTARHMARCWDTVPHVTQHHQADLTDLEAARKRLAPRVEEAGGKLTLTALLLKVVAGALKAFPQFNASIDTATEEIVYKESLHIGIAVDTPRGLLVPVVRDVDRKNITELAVELTAMAGRAREGKIAPDELQGGGFSISNLGGIGGGHFTPIVNWPEVAILGIGRGSLQPVYNGESFEPRLMLPLSLSYDHRLIDGADGARFVSWVAHALEEPLLLSLEG